MMILDPILRGVVLPAVVAAMVLCIAAAVRRHPGRWFNVWIPPVSVALATMGAFAALFHFPAFPPNEHWQVIFYLIATSALAGGLVHTQCITRYGQMAAGLLVVILFAMFIVPSWEDLADARWWWRALAGISVVVVWLSVDRAARQPSSSLRLIELILITSALAGLLMMSHNAKFAQCAGTLASALGGLLVGGLFCRGKFSSSHVAGPFAMLLVGLSLLGIFYDYGTVPRPCYAIIALTPWWVVLWRGQMVRVQRWWLAGAIELMLVSIPLGSALGWAWSQTGTSVYAP